MGLSLSLLLSAWNEVTKHKFLPFTDTLETVLVRSLSFKEQESEKAITKDKESIEAKGRKASAIKTPGNMQIRKPTITLRQPEIMFSPGPVTELDAAATKLQKVYKSYRTRRNLADCAVIVEDLWGKASDSAFLTQSLVSFFNIEEPGSAVSKWLRARTRDTKVGMGLSKDEKAQKLAAQHWLEAIDPRHRCGHNLYFYFDIWHDSKSAQPFFYWLDVGDAKGFNLKKCRRRELQRQYITYLGPIEREAYEVIVESGKLVYRQNGLLVNTIEGSKWIFVLSTSRSLYVGQKKKGVFQHSSILSRGAATAAGRLVAHDGVLEAIWPDSGHYLPTEDNFKEFISFLQEHQVDLSNVKRYAVDSDETSAIVKPSKDKKPKELNSFSSSTTVALDINAGASGEGGAKAPAPVFDLCKRLSCKWTSGFGPRIGCVRDYPPEL